MPSSRRWTLRLRLEDVVALVFFFVNLGMRIVLREISRLNLSPGDVLIIIPAVCLLFAKELVQYFVAGEKRAAEARGSLALFVRPYWEIARDWFPFLVILMMYYSLWGDATHLLVSSDRDEMLMRWDQKLFGVQASVALQPFVTPALTGWMSFAYFFHLLNIPIVACFIYLRRPSRRFREMMNGVLVVCFLGILGYLIVPAIGPLYTLREQYTVPLSQPLSLLNRQMDFLDFARIRRDVFPSLHVALSFLVWLYAYRNSRTLFWILSPLIVSLWISTVYLRFHYLVDVAAGLILAPVSFWLANTLFARFAEIDVTLPVPAAWAGRLSRVRAATPAGGPPADPGRKAVEQP